MINGSRFKIDAHEVVENFVIIKIRYQGVGTWFQVYDHPNPEVLLLRQRFDPQSPEIIASFRQWEHARNFTRFMVLARRYQDASMLWSAEASTVDEHDSVVSIELELHSLALGATDVV